MNSSMSEEMIRHSRAGIDIIELQESLGTEMDLNASFKLGQGSIANKVISNANFAPDRFVFQCRSSTFYSQIPCLKIILIKFCHQLLHYLKLVDPFYCSTICTTKIRKIK